MTTPTREQVIEWAKALNLSICHSVNGPGLIMAGEVTEMARELCAIAMSAGREQGLREAKEVCEHNTGTPGDCASAIDKLRTKP